MRYYRIIALLVLILSSLIAFGCGGNKAFMQLGASAQTSQVPRMSQNRHIAWDCTGKSPSDAGLRTEQQFTYDFSSYPSQQGFTVVPMLNEREPA